MRQSHVPSGDRTMLNRISVLVIQTIREPVRFQLQSQISKSMPSRFQSQGLAIVQEYTVATIVLMSHR